MVSEEVWKLLHGLATLVLPCDGERRRDVAMHQYDKSVGTVGET